MAMGIHELFLLMDEHKRSPLEGPVLILGRQLLRLSYDRLLTAMAEAGVKPRPLPPGQNLGPIIAERQGTDETSDEVMFRTLVADEVHALDFTPSEGADIIADLNLPIDPALHNKFGLIIDGGTMEHIFDIRQAFRNIADLLRPGGKIVHISPVNQHVNHGFIQMSPTLFFDYYETNDFAEVHAKIIVSKRYNSFDGSFRTDPWHIFDYDPSRHGASLFSTDREGLEIFFLATKTTRSSSDRIPIQSFYNPNRKRNCTSEHWLVRHSPTGVEFEPA